MRRWRCLNIAHHALGRHVMNGCGEKLALRRHVLVMDRSGAPPLAGTTDFDAVMADAVMAKASAEPALGAESRLGVDSQQIGLRFAHLTTTHRNSPVFTRPAEGREVTKLAR